MSAIPWSSMAEWKLRRRITLLWIGMWAAAIGGLFVFGAANVYHSLFYWGFACLSVWVALLYFLNHARVELGDEMGRLPNGQFHEGSGMLANKPRSTANLTRWIKHPSGEGAFYCECDRNRYGVAVGNRVVPRRWTDAQWIPNYDPEQFAEDRPNLGDPGGGRFVILCHCGIGHFKLKA